MRATSPNNKKEFAYCHRVGLGPLIRQSELTMTKLSAEAATKIIPSRKVKRRAGSPAEGPAASITPSWDPGVIFIRF